VAPLGGSELSQVIATFPIGFIERSTGSYTPVAVLALSKGGNLFVGPGGQWLCPRVPTVASSIIVQSAARAIELVGIKH
jgi:SapC